MPKLIPDVFQHCPRCGVENQHVGSNPFHCGDCDFLYYFNPAVAVAGVVTDDRGRVLFLRRARDPGKGRLGLPGGFVDLGESTEDALIREVKEEVNLDVSRLHYITALPNTYIFRDLAYIVADVFYSCDIVSMDAMEISAKEIESCFFCHPTEKELAEMAFASNRKAVEMYLQQRPLAS